jgi:hypothetical protein
MKAGQLLRYSEREKIIKEELKPLIPKYKRYEHGGGPKKLDNVLSSKSA